jgi:hypothetical protein
VIKAFINIVNNYQTTVNAITNGSNRANNMGNGLEEYIKDIFADTSSQTDKAQKLLRWQNIYSYSGNKNNPPDLFSKIVMKKKFSMGKK